MLVLAPVPIISVLMWFTGKQVTSLGHIPLVSRPIWITSLSVHRPRRRRLAGAYTRSLIKALFTESIRDH